MLEPVPRKPKPKEGKAHIGSVTVTSLGKPITPDTIWQSVLMTFQHTREFQGSSTIKHMKRLIKTLRDEAQMLYGAADYLERNPKAAIITKRPVDAIRERWEARGFKDDPLDERATTNIKKASVEEPKTPTEFRRLAMQIVDAAERKRDWLAWYLNLLKTKGRGVGRHRSVAMDFLLDGIDTLGIADAEAARRLANVPLVPDGPGSDEPGLAERWATIIKSARSRRGRPKRSASR